MNNSQKLGVYLVFALGLAIFLLGFVNLVNYNGAKVSGKPISSTPTEVGSSYSCQDSDSGVDFFNAGQVVIYVNQIGLTPSADSCSGNTLTEYSCNSSTSSKPTSQTYVCPFGCEDGACLKCYDADANNGNGFDYSSNNGINYFVRDVNMSEECVPNSNVLKEHYCVSINETNVTYHDCGSNSLCYDGACHGCMDYDSTDLIGPNYTSMGYTWNSSYPNGIEDYCDSEGLLIESYCSGSSSNIVQDEVNCSTEFGSSYYCSQGSCVCESNILLINPDEPCRSDETRVLHYHDMGGCSPDYSVVDYCDYDGNGIIYDDSNSDVENLFIGSGSDLSPYDDSANYTSQGEQTVEIDKGVNFIKFNWDFSNPLNLYNTKIDSGVNSEDMYYIAVRNMSVSNKTIYLKISNNSNSVCIRDSDNVTLSDFSEDCNESGEVLVPCPGSSNNSVYHCQIQNGYYKVWPLAHSGVLEMSNGDVGGCIPSWSCSNWSNYEEQCGNRTCTDVTGCQEDYVDTKTCYTSCTPDWNCPSWDTIKCGSGEKLRTCVDINGCQEDKTETIPCDIKETHNGSWLPLVLILLGIIIFIAVAIYLVLHKKDKGEEPNAPIQKTYVPPTSPSTFGQVYRPRPVA